MVTDLYLQTWVEVAGVVGQVGDQKLEELGMVVVFQERMVKA